MTIDVVVAEDHPLFRAGLAALLDGLDDTQVVGTTDSVSGVLELASARRPDVVVLDLGLVDGNGLSAVGPLLAQGCRVLVLSAADDDAAVHTALRAGAQGYLLKTSPPAQFGRAVRTVAAGGGAYDGAVVERISRHFSSGGRTSATGLFPQLSARERDVLALMAEGRSNAEIADHYVLSLKTVRNHVSNVLTKLGVSTRAEAIVRAREAGLGAHAR
jgi:DNA-binding NarL/FixJ family response regulator